MRRLIVAAACSLLLAACDVSSGGSNSQPPQAANPNGQGNSVWSDADEAQDVTGTKLTCKTQFGSQDCTVTFTIVNHSTKTSDYDIEYNIESKDGSKQYSSSFIFVTGLRPGQSKTERDWVTDHIPDPSSARIVVTSGDRSES